MKKDESAKPNPYFIFFLSTKHHCCPNVKPIPPAATEVMAATAATTTIIISTITNSNGNYRFLPPSLRRIPHRTSTTIRDFDGTGSSGGATLMLPTMSPTPICYRIHRIIPESNTSSIVTHHLPCRDHLGNAGDHREPPLLNDSNTNHGYPMIYGISMFTAKPLFASNKSNPFYFFSISNYLNPILFYFTDFPVLIE